MGPAVRLDEPRWPGNGGVGVGGGGEPWCPSGLSPKWRDSLEDLSCKGAVLRECMIDTSPPPTPAAPGFSPCFLIPAVLGSGPALGTPNLAFEAQRQPQDWSSPWGPNALRSGQEAQTDGQHFSKTSPSLSLSGSEDTSWGPGLWCLGVYPHPEPEPHGGRKGCLHISPISALSSPAFFGGDRGGSSLLHAGFL